MTITLTSTTGVEIPLPVVDTAVDVDGTGFVARVTQTVANDLADPMEAEFRFPLPSGAAVTDIIVRWEVAESISEARWLPDDDDPESGTIEVVVRTNDTEGGSSPVDVVRPVDRSGSISGWGEQAAQDLSVSVVEALRPDDTVTVIAFDSKRGTLALDARRVRLPLGSPTTVRRSAGRHRRDHRWRLDHWPMTSASRCCSRSAGCTGTCCDREGAPGSEAARRHQLVTVQYSERSPTCCTHGA